MIEKVYQFTDTNDFIMEKIIDDEHVNINHIVVAPGGSVPVHVANSNVYQIIVRGKISLRLEEEPVAHYPTGSIVAIPFNTKMDIRQRRQRDAGVLRSSRLLTRALCQQRRRSDTENKPLPCCGLKAR